MRDFYDNIFDLVIGLEDLLEGVFQLEESKLWNRIYKKRFLEVVTEEEKSILNFDVKELLKKATRYRNALKHYSENYEKYDKTNTIQENDLHYTTDKFFTQVVNPLREKTLRSLKQLTKMLKSSKSKDEVNTLEKTKSLIIQDTNKLIDICIRIIEFNKEKLLDHLQKVNIDFKQKYNLIHISSQDF